MKASFFTESVLYWLARGVSALAQRATPEWNARIGAGVGVALYHLAGKRRAVAMGNLRAAFGDSYSADQYEGILRSLHRNLGRTLLEVAAIPRIDRAYVDQYVQVAPGSRERLEAALAKGRGVLFVTGHFGNWELISLTGALHGYPTLVLARAQGWPRLNRLLTQYRESKGCRVVTKGFPVRDLIRGLREGKIIGILADQDGGANGVLAPLFGRLASTAAGAIALGINTGAPIIPVFMVRQEGPLHSLVLEEPLQIPEQGDLEDRVRAGVAAYLSVLERYIRRYPDQWFWLHRRWKSCPERHVVVLSDGKAGHLAQCRELVERVKTAWDARSAGDKRLAGVTKPLVWKRTIPVRYRHPAWRPVLQLVAAALPRRFPSAERWLRWALDPESYRMLASTFADVTVSCGSSTAAVNLIWSWAVRAKSAHITRSGLPSWRRFDLAVIPRHDLRRPPRAGNLLVIDGALAPSRRADESRAKEWRQRLRLSRGRQIGVLLGGPAKGVEIPLADVERAVGGLLSAAEELDAELLVTSSRRTPLAVETWLAQALGRHPRCRLLALVNRRDAGRLDGTEEAVPCIFGLSHALVVSGDSISMVSEAVATGKPVISFPPRPLRQRRWGGPDTKYHRFLRRMDDLGSVQVVEASGVKEAVARAVRDGVGSVRAELVEARTVSPFDKPALRAPEGLRVTGQGSDPVVEFLKRWL
ncbi:MAG: mitochondrial fission ELM1 family protein [Candidatus Omnitrophica bacterium]|nr:mitochondrial fission ELM1 family protein [Candidatus Omnitrophota bacterium]